MTRSRHQEGRLTRAFYVDEVSETVFDQGIAMAIAAQVAQSLKGIPMGCRLLARQQIRGWPFGVHYSCMLLSLRTGKFSLLGPG